MTHFFRQAITWDNGFVFNPMDLFNLFPPTAIDRNYKVGDDMINAHFSLSHKGLRVGLVLKKNFTNLSNTISTVWVKTIIRMRCWIRLSPIAWPVESCLPSDAII